MTVVAKFDVEGSSTSEKVSETEWAIGPGSITWKVLRDPVTFIVGQIRNSMVLLFHPPFAASSEHDTFIVDPLLRFRRVGMYAYAATYGKKSDAEKFSHMVRTRHGQVVGTDPITQRPYQSHSEYELALTSVIQSTSYLFTYEAAHGQLSAEDRDQFYFEQKVPAAMIGIQPKHLPNTFDEAMAFLDAAHDRFAVGLIGRELLAPYDKSDYPEGTAMGDLPYFRRKLGLYATRVVSDMAALTLLPKEKLLYSINRRPKMFNQSGVKLSLKAFSFFMRSKLGMKAFEWYVQKKVFKTFSDALRVEDAPGYENRKAAFVVPDPESCYRELPDLKRNWPGRMEDYALGREVENEVVVAESVLSAVNS